VPSRQSVVFDGAARALISPDTPECSVLFRVLGDGAAARVEYRPTNCSFNPGLDAPAEAHRALSGSR
jgi:hypothetical protein